MPAPTSPEPDNSAKNVPAASPANKDNKAPVAPINTLPKLPMPNEKGATDATKAQPKATMPPPPVAAKPKPASLYYTLKKGDTFYKIAERYHTTPKQLMEWNNMAENDLVPGDKIIVKP